LTIVGDLFAPGSAAISDRYENLLGRIGEALASFPNGQVVVTGHTDNTPIRTLRFMSNADLSRARAQSVADAIASRVPHARILSKGAGADEPIGDNNTAAGRARNRRVEIVLYTRETQRQ